MTIESPDSRDQLIAAFDQQAISGAAYWEAFAIDTFFSRLGESWSPAETVRHLSKSTRPVVKALATPRIVLRLMFGRSRRPSLSYDEVRVRYQGALAEGGQAGRFAPSPRQENDRESWRAAIMADFAGVNRDLRAVISRWPDRHLDLLRLPHPLLGKLTVREMLFFTLYHQRHHVAVVERHLKEQRPSPGL